MYLKKSKNKKNGRTYLYIADGYHDKEKGYTKTVTVQSLGYLDVLEKQLLSNKTYALKSQLYQLIQVHIFIFCYQTQDT